MTNQAAENMEPVDLFEHQERLPAKVRGIIERHTEKLEEAEQDTYTLCRHFLEDIESTGYTFDLSLDGVPFDLRYVG